jgi:hypothetical protein
MRSTDPTRRQVLGALAASAATLVDHGSPLARLIAQQPCGDAAAAGTLIGTVPLFRAGAPVQPFGVKVGGPGLDARLVTDLSLLQPDRLITPERASLYSHRAVPRRPRRIEVRGRSRPPGWWRMRDRWRSTI